ncbi:MAG: thiosulfate oxidation carrier protein SoxY, partial [Betaproteobacteria bacterium]
MNTSTKRRVFLKGSMAATAVGVAVGAGLLAPRAVLAAWPEEAFKTKEIAVALKTLLGSDAA